MHQILHAHRIFFRRSMHTEFSSCGTRKPWTKQQPRLPIGPPHSLDPIHHSYFFFFFEMNHLKLQWIFCYKFSWSSLIIEIQYNIWLATNPVSSTPKITRRLCSNRKLVHVAGAWLGLIYFSKDSVGCMDPQVFRSGWFFEVLVFFLKFDSDKHTFCLLYLGSWEIHWWHIWFTIF